MSAIYAKSFLAGLAALVLAVFLLPFGFVIASFFYKAPPSSDGTAMSWDLRSAAGPWYVIFPLVGVLIFGIGFVWEYRRASRQIRLRE
jgi:hypothetical protein